MRVLIAPDKFAGTLTAVEAARAIADGWARQAPDDDLDLAPMADGGPGFVDVLHEALGGELSAVTVTGPHHEPVPGAVLRRVSTAWVESAQACGLRSPAASGPRTPPHGASVSWSCTRSKRAPPTSWSASAARARTTAAPACWGRSVPAPTGRSTAVRPDSTASPRSTSAAARAAVGGVRLTAASDVDSPLTGLFGATKTYGPQKGIPEDRLPALDGILEQLAAATDRRTALEKGAGAAGGLGFALLLLGASRRPGFDVVAGAVDLSGRARAADLVLTGEGAFDFSSRSGKVPYGVATVAAEALRPCVALAGRVLVGLPRDACPGDRVGVLPRRPGGGGACPRRPCREPGAARGAGRAHLVALSRRAVHRAVAIPRNNHRCARIAPVRRA